MSLYITKDQSSCVGYWIHKGLRWSGDPASGRAWNAIQDLAGDEWRCIVECALMEAGIKVRKRPKPRKKYAKGV